MLVLFQSLFGQCHNFQERHCHYPSVHKNLIFFQHVLPQWIHKGTFPFPSYLSHGSVLDERKHTHKIEMYPNMAPSCYMNKLTLQKHPCLLACPLGTNVLIILEFCQRVKTPLAQSFFFLCVFLSFFLVSQVLFWWSTCTTVLVHSLHA